MNINNKLRFRDTTPDQVGNCTFWFLRRRHGKNEVQEGILSKQERKPAGTEYQLKITYFLCIKTQANFGMEVPAPIMSPLNKRPLKNIPALGYFFQFHPLSSKRDRHQFSTNDINAS